MSSLCVGNKGIINSLSYPLLVLWNENMYIFTCSDVITKVISLLLSNSKII